MFSFFLLSFLFLSLSLISSLVSLYTGSPRIFRLKFSHKRIKQGGHLKASFQATSFSYERWCMHASINDACTLYRLRSHKCRNMRQSQIPSGSNPCLDVLQWFCLFHPPTCKIIKRNATKMSIYPIPFLALISKLTPQNRLATGRGILAGLAPRVFP